MRKWLFGLFLLLIISGCEANENHQDEVVNNNHKHLNNIETKAEQYPDSLGIQLQLVNAYDSIGDAKKALSHLNKLVDADKGNYGLWFRKAQLEGALSDTNAAIRSYNTALKIYPSPEAMLNLANLYAERRNEQCLSLVNTVLKMGLGRETDAHCYFISGVYYARKFEIKQAESAFDKCIANNYTYMEAYIEKGLLYFDMKNYRQALSIFQFASTVNNLYPDAYYYIARCYEQLGLKDSAILRFKHALSLDPNLQEAKIGLKRLDN